MPDRLRWLDTLGNTAAGVFAVDHRQRIVYWNAAAEGLLGLTARGVLGQPCYEVIAGCASGAPFCGPGCAVQRRVARFELPEAFEIRTRTGDGRWMWLHVSVVVVSRGPDLFSVHVVHDVSAQKQAVEILSQIRSIISTPVDPGCGSPLTNRNDPAGRATTPESHTLAGGTLTRRELEVLRLLAAGVATVTIAKRLGISRYTVRRHVQAVLTKCGAHSRAEAVSLAFRARLFD